jgi:hypothetical protein
MGRPRKHNLGEAPTAVQRSSDFVIRLRKAGGKRRSYNWRPEVTHALDILRDANPQLDETRIIGDLVLAAAAAVAVMPSDD